MKDVASVGSISQVPARAFLAFSRWFAHIHPRFAQYRAAIALTTYGMAAVASYWLTFTFRWGWDWNDLIARTFLLSLPVFVIFTLLTVAFFGLSIGRWRFIGASDLLRLIGALAVSGSGFALLVSFAGWPVFVPLRYAMGASLLTLNMIAGVWLTYRLAYEQRRCLTTGAARRVIIIGAGEAGSMLAREMLRGRTGYLPVAFFDDQPRMWHATVHGIEVKGPTSALSRVAPSLHADEIVIATPGASPETMRRIVDACDGAKLPYRVLPGIASVLAGNVNLNQLREVRIEDLLGREPVDIELPELSEDLRGRSVLITGAAGSIGSELARQVALHDPAVLILFDQAETPLFYLERELREKHPDIQMIFIVGDIVDEVVVERLFHDYAPSRVYHAAAYKHVSTMQMNPREAIRNNVLGTFLIADAAGRTGTEKFVLVSTDKAVRPTSVMGATKRLAEIAILELQQTYPETSYAAVRFGNVLGSSGSVLPLFKEQLAAGKPLTVTHPEVTRYFMTIPEAVHLILQASLLPDMHGRIAMLEMGEPVRILELAQNLLRLSGKSYAKGKGTVFTGLRVGEKLHEELVGPDELTKATAVPKVRLVESTMMSLRNIRDVLDECENAFVAKRDNELPVILGAFFPDLQLRSGSLRPATDSMVGLASSKRKERMIAIPLRESSSPAE